MTALQSILRSKCSELIILIILSIAAEVFTETSQTCTMPSGEEGQCVNIGSCPILMEFIRNPIGEIQEYLNNSRCDDKGKIKICCPASLNSTIFCEETLKNESSKTQLIDRSSCGYRNQDAMSAYEFPWMGALTAFGWPLCSCTLINARYVLTTAAWAAPNIVDDSKKTGLFILFGEFDQKNGNCSKEFGGSDYGCALFENLGIEEAIPHPFFEDGQYGENNIGLIRLNRTIIYTDRIRPICLPIFNTPLPEAGDILYTSGWATHNDSKTGKTKIKNKLSSIVLTKKQCQKRMKFCSENYTIPQNSMCMEVTKDSATTPVLGEMGSTVMNPYNNQWHMEGIVVTYRELCYLEPLLYTPVLPYLGWIESNMRPW